MLDPIEELARLLGWTSKEVPEQLLRLVDASAKGLTGIAQDALNALAGLFARKLASADMLGRYRLVLEAEDARGGKRKIAPTETYVPPRPAKPVFDEAVVDIISRRPELARSAAAVQEVYKRHGFACAQATSLEVSRRVQKEILTGIQEGVDLRHGTEVVERLTGWTQAYSETVYRTNLTSAYTAGRFQQANSADVNDVIGAFGFQSRNDADTRPNHRAAHGLIAPTNDSIWDRLSPPLGYRCRCQIRLVSRFDLERRGLIRDGRIMRFEPAGLSAAGPDPGFISIRPDRRIYAA